MTEFSYQKYLEQHHQITELALSLIHWALNEGKPEAALKSCRNALQQIEEAKLPGGRQLLSTIAMLESSTKVTAIRRRKKGGKYA